MDNESRSILIESQNSDDDGTRKTCLNTANTSKDEGKQGQSSGAPQTPDRNDSDILIIDEDSPELTNKLNTNLNISETTRSPGRTSDQQTSSLKEETAQTQTKSESDTEMSRSGQIDHSALPSSSGGTSGSGEIERGNKSNTPKPDKLTSATCTQTAENLSGGMATGSEVSQCTNGQTLQRSASAPADESNLNQAALTLLKRLEFKNPGRKQMDYGNFNPEESEREKKKLRRFQTLKPRGNACYKEDGTLFDGRDICDCLNEECPGCFYPCPQCESPKCGPTCRSSRKWVYDYIEDEGRNYKVEFPESAINFGV